jgi:hypothetical protein
MQLLHGDFMTIYAVENTCMILVLGPLQFLRTALLQAVKPNRRGRPQFLFQNFQINRLISMDLTLEARVHRPASLHEFFEF